MTPEAQRIAIAELCGWKRYVHAHGVELIDPSGQVVNNNYGEEWRLPDYLNDLNAMHEAEKTLCEADQVEFVLRLGEIVRRGKPVGNGLHSWENIHATSAQRAEAFLRVKGRWVE